MIANATEMMFAARSLSILERSLEALREQLQTDNPGLLAVTARSYEKRIATVQLEIAQYLGEHPAAISQLLDAQIHEDAIFAGTRSA